MIGIETLPGAALSPMGELAKSQGLLGADATGAASGDYAASWVGDAPNPTQPAGPLNSAATANPVPPLASAAVPSVPAANAATDAAAAAAAATGGLSAATNAIVNGGAAGAGDVLGTRAIANTMQPAQAAPAAPAERTAQVYVDRKGNPLPTQPVTNGADGPTDEEKQKAAWRAYMAEWEGEQEEKRRAAYEDSIKVGAGN